MKSILLAGLPVLVMLAACDSQDKATTNSEAPVVPGDDGAVAAPDGDGMTTTAPVDGEAAQGPAPVDGTGDGSDTESSPTPGTPPEGMPPPANDTPPPAKK